MAKILSLSNFRVRYTINDCPKELGTVGVSYDSYRHVNGPETVDLHFYFFSINFELGPKFFEEE